jgi:hypothetical protein
MCVYTQTVTAIGPERKREREMTSGASSPAGGGDESVHLLGSLLLFHRKYIVVSFRRFVCGAVHKNVAKEKTSSAALYTTQRTHTHKFWEMIINRYRFILIFIWYRLVGICHLDSKPVFKYGHTIKKKKKKKKKEERRKEKNTRGDISQRPAGRRHDPMVDVTTTVMCNQPVPLSLALCSRFLSPPPTTTTTTQKESMPYTPISIPATTGTPVTR